MLSSQIVLMTIIFTLTIILMLWRPFGINETIPTTIGALTVLVAGIVPWMDVLNIFDIIRGASLTILSTIMMSIVLESIGFFRWIALNIIIRSKGSGVRLFVYTNLLCFFMTMFFNNDGSILITTPIIIHIVTLLKIKPHQKIPFLISGALIATAASAPIAVSNISNLIALKIVGLSLNSYINMMFVPSMIGILTIGLLLYLYFKKDLPRKIPSVPVKWDNTFSRYVQTHPLDVKQQSEDNDWKLFKLSFAIVILTRVSFFALTPFGVPLELIGMVGAFLLIILRWYKTKTGLSDIVKKTPWHVLLFAFNMYVLVYGLKNVGLNDYLVSNLKPLIMDSPFNATMIMGILLTILSNLFNNLPAVMIGTLSITEMGLDPHLVQIAYLANVIGSDIGALLTPVGTLATLIWMYILKKHSINISWGKYLRVTFLIIPIGLIVSLISLYFWTTWLLK
ncbi:arsenic transporter [Peribacillus frigoritolerans]|uniref:arsenic transporter n=1 Tax=Peribacillus frigoritolerans TaxID=450367 RepID=UPI002227BC78|nr:arsenic transporter [Peribacillus frigoritolerans]UYY98160.1 arsenic transporter [Peribacillus frigoritolerans]